MSADEVGVVEWPTLWVAPAWIERHCVVPDGLRQGQPFRLVGWQLWVTVNRYRVKPDARPVGTIVAGHETKPASAFHYRRVQVVLPQKAGKAPLTATHISLEAVGPAVFAGWAVGGEQWRCWDHGCSCGWRYSYAPGEPMGVPWATPLIQITATSDDQTDNIYDALRPMIDKGPLHEMIPKTGEEFIRLPGDGEIAPVTSNARSRLGQRVTDVEWDETGLYTDSNRMRGVYDTQRRGLAGMGGRGAEWTNSWDPNEDSVAQRTAESAAQDVFRFHPLAPAGLSYTNKRERRRIHRHVYMGSSWVDLDAIEAEAADLLEHDPGQAERFFGNRVVPGQGAAFSGDRWRELTDVTVIVADRRVITVGVDGARFDDALGIVATDVEAAHQWPLGIWEVPADAPPDYEHPFDQVDGTMVDAFDRWDVWRVYVDPQMIEHLLERWQGRWGDKRVVPWWMNRPKQTAHAVRRFATALTAGDVTNDGDSHLERHIRNARRWTVNVRDDKGRQMWVIGKDHPHSPRKMDAAAAAVLSWEARGDAIAAGALNQRAGSWYAY